MSSNLEIKDGPSLYFIRHAESQWNAARRAQPAAALTEALRDADLSPAGVAQLAAVAATVAAIPAKVVYCSPLARARRTAAAFAGTFTNVPVVELPCLREVRRDWSDLGPAGTGWWFDAACAACAPQHECDACVARRCAEVRATLGALTTSAIIVGHSDLLVALLGWDAKNCEIKCVSASVFAVTPDQPSCRTNSSTSDPVSKSSAAASPGVASGNATSAAAASTSAAGGAASPVSSSPS